SVPPCLTHSLSRRLTTFRSHWTRLRTKTLGTTSAAPLFFCQFPRRDEEPCGFASLRETDPRARACRRTEDIEDPCFRWRSIKLCPAARGLTFSRRSNERPC